MCIYIIHYHPHNQSSIIDINHQSWSNMVYYIYITITPCNIYWIINRPTGALASPPWGPSPGPRWSVHWDPIAQPWQDDDGSHALGGLRKDRKHDGNIIWKTYKKWMDDVDDVDVDGGKRMEKVDAMERNGWTYMDGCTVGYMVGWGIQVSCWTSMIANIAAKQTNKAQGIFTSIHQLFVAHLHSHVTCTFLAYAQLRGPGKDIRAT